MGGVAVALDGVEVHYPGGAALAGIDLRIDAGERIALVGPSGAGKTTLLRACAGMLRVDRGRVTVDAVDLATCDQRGLRRVRSSIGFVHQDLALVPNLRVAQNVVAGRLGQRSFLGAVRDVVLPANATLERVHELLVRVGIGAKVFERTDRLSGGERQRVAIARALFQEPRALLADEPVASVDPSRARDTIELLTSISRSDGVTLCVSLHDFELARACFPRLVGLRAGRVAFDRGCEDVTAADVAALYDLTP